jgi:hypothetical protein
MMVRECKIEWEIINYEDIDADIYITERLQVIGGWVVKSSFNNSEKNMYGESSVFVPDPNHEWKL